MTTSTGVSVLQRPVEPLLGPILDLIGRNGPLDTRSIIRALAADGRLGPISPSEMEMHTEIGQTVVLGTVILNESGLIQSEGPARWSITSGGRRLIAKEGKAISFAILGKRPQYRDYQRRLSKEHLRRGWQKLRFDYYVVGRLAALEGSAHAAPTSLAYAIEHSMKAGLPELVGSVDKKMSNSHNLKDIYKYCLERGLFLDTHISEDFLEYAQDQFERRYPRLESDLLSRRMFWSFGTSSLVTYDDCIIQLEKSLDRLYGSPRWSLGTLALTAPVGGNLAQTFFHANVFAVERLPEYRASIPSEGSIRYPEPQNLDRPDLLFSSRDKLGTFGLAYPRARDLLNLQLAARYVYPKYGEPNPDPVRILGAHGSAAKTPYEWFLRRLRDEFGSCAVEVAEDRKNGTTAIVVYDRLATRYWQSLPVRRDHLPLIVENESSRVWVERWIDDAKARFAAYRRLLRLPPSPAGKA